jgi:exopolyphosphatase/guanosine-5'-triphosphate,3'-diphosphate pyrophosphatase
MNFLDNLSFEKNSSPLVAAVDLGSNSFHLLIGRIEKTDKGLEIISIDNLKEPVKLASGLDEHKILDSPSKSRAVVALERFGERLRSISPDLVRVVATNTFRIAKNGKTLLKKCEQSLGFPIEVISGVEEARLIYNGVCNSLNNDGLTRLVIDIGGGSTEFVIGCNTKPEILESIFIGCIKLNKEFFVGNVFDEKIFAKAVFFSRKEIQVISSAFKNRGWDVVYGCSGTVKSIHDVLVANNFSAGGITLESLDSLVSKMIKVKSCNTRLINGLKTERVSVFAGGLAILYAIFKELKIERMELSNAALRLGVLYDIVGRGRDGDIRSLTIEKFIDRYEVDRVQIGRIRQLAIHFWDQLCVDGDAKYLIMSKVLTCAINFLEIGHSISHNSYHKHSSYIVSNSEMPGFSKGEQQLMAKIVLGHVGKISKVVEMTYEQIYCYALVSIRLASIFSRSRTDLKPPKMLISAEEKKFTLNISENWLNSHPLTKYTLEQESKEWSRVGIGFLHKST